MVPHPLTCQLSVAVAAAVADRLADALHSHAGRGITSNYPHNKRAHKSSITSAGPIVSPSAQPTPPHTHTHAL